MTEKPTEKTLLDVLEYLVDTIDQSMHAEHGLHTWQCAAPDHGKCKIAVRIFGENNTRMMERLEKKVITEKGYIITNCTGCERISE